MPRSEDTSDVVKIVGTKEGVDKARHIVQTISDEQVQTDISLPPPPPLSPSLFLYILRLMSKYAINQL